jgi:hypothetical protein
VQRQHTPAALRQRTLNLKFLQTTPTLLRRVSRWLNCKDEPRPVVKIDDWIRAAGSDSAVSAQSQFICGEIQPLQSLSQ